MCVCVCVCVCVCRTLWHVKEIEFHKEIWSLIRLFISMQGSGLNLTVIYDSLRHVLSSPTSPPFFYPTPPPPTHPHSSRLHTHLTSSSSPPNTFQSKNTLFCWLSVSCIITPTSHAEANPCSSVRSPQPLKVLQVLWGSLSHLPPQNKTSLWFRASGGSADALQLLQM